MLPLASAFFLLASQAFGGESSGVSAAWQQASGFLFQEAHQTFQDATDAEDRERRLGLAVTTLGLQPRTQRNIAVAESGLRKLVAENAEDDAGRKARFFLARVLENHRSDPGPAEIAEARRIYLELLAENTADPLLESGAARIAYIDLYAAGNDADKLASAEAQLRRLEPLLRTPAGRREFHSAVGFTLVELGGDRTAALEHLLAAVQIHNPLPQVQSETLLAAAALAEATGRRDVARKYYTQFVREFSRDSRNFSVRKILENLPATDDGTDS